MVQIYINDKPMPWNRKDYPPDWEQTRERILRRAGHRCEDCGVSNHSIIDKADRKAPSAHQWLMYNDLIRRQYGKGSALRIMKFTEIVLTIAHLDHDKDNWEITDDRLKALCQRCHLRYDLPRHIENRKYGRNFRKNQHKLF